MIFYDPKKRTLPQQVQKNKEDIKEIKENLASYFSTSLTLTEETTSILASQTNVPADFEIGNNTFLIDQNALAFKIVADYLDDNNARTFTLLFYANFKGAQGEQGVQGAQGKGFNFMNTWVSGNEYHKNDVVTYAGSDGITRTYVLITEQLIGSTTAPDEDTTNWGLMLGGNSNLQYQDLTSVADVRNFLLQFTGAPYRIKGLKFIGDGQSASWNSILKTTFNETNRYFFGTSKYSTTTFNPFIDIGSSVSETNAPFIIAHGNSDTPNCVGIETDFISIYRENSILKMRITASLQSQFTISFVVFKNNDYYNEFYQAFDFPEGCKLRIYYK